MNKELQDANEELQAANEELMLTQEELQATNEELQTTNDELTARTTELHELSHQHRIEQLELSSVLERFPHYAMVLNAGDLTIHAVNSAYEQLFATRNVIGLSLTDVFAGKDMEDFTRV